MIMIYKERPMLLLQRLNTPSSFKSLSQAAAEQIASTDVQGVPLGPGKAVLPPAGIEA